MDNTPSEQVVTNLMRGKPALQPDRPASNASRMRSRRASRQSFTPDSNDLAASNGSSSKVYTAPDFRAQLEKGYYGVRLHMDEAEEDEGPTDENEAFLNTLRETSYDTPADERYMPQVLSERLKRLENKNEVTVTHCLHDLACPGAEDLAALNVKNKGLREKYTLLVDHWNERWQHMAQLMPGFPQPQPDYCVGFARKAFSLDELDRLSTVTKTTSGFTATAYLYFPFLTCEVKSHKAPIYETDNQNAYSMMLAVTAIVDLFRAAKMEESVNRQVLGFALCYNHMNIRLDGYYPIIAGARTDIYRKNLYHYQLSPSTAAVSSNSNTTWQSWHFIRNIYESWAPKHLEHLRHAINSLDITAINTARAALGLIGNNNNNINTRDSATPTPSESANTGLKNLDLQSSAPHPQQQQVPPPEPEPEPEPVSDNVRSVHSGNQRRTKRTAIAAPAEGDLTSPKRQRVV